MLSRVTTAGWVWGFTVYSYGVTTVSAAWFMRRAVEARGGRLSIADSLIWQGAAFALWLPVSVIVWLVIRRFGAGLAALGALTVAGLAIVPLAAVGGAAIDLAFAEGATADLMERALTRTPVAILLYTAICAVGAAALHRSRAAAARAYAQSLEAVVRSARELVAAPRLTPDRLIVMAGSRRVPVLLDEIEWFGAAGNYVVAHWADREGLLRQPLKTLETALDARVFVRSHRSIIVNLALVRQTQSLSDGSWKLTMASGAELVASRTYRDAVMERLGRPADNRLYSSRRRPG